jgi:hypothetical protein
MPKKSDNGTSTLNAIVENAFPEYEEGSNTVQLSGDHWGGL